MPSWNVVGVKRKDEGISMGLEESDIMVLTRRGSQSSASDCFEFFICF